MGLLQAAPPGQRSCPLLRQYALPSAPPSDKASHPGVPLLMGASGMTKSVTRYYLSHLPV